MTNSAIPCLFFVFLISLAYSVKRYCQVNLQKVSALHTLVEWFENCSFDGFKCVFCRSFWIGSNKIRVYAVYRGSMHSVPMSKSIESVFDLNVSELKKDCKKISDLSLKNLDVFSDDLLWRYWRWGKVTKCWVREFHPDTGKVARHYGYRSREDRHPKLILDLTVN